MGVQATACHGVFHLILGTPLNSASFSSTISSHLETVRLVSGQCSVGTLHFCELQFPLPSSVSFSCEEAQVRGGALGRSSAHSTHSLLTSGWTFPRTPICCVGPVALF